MVPTPVAKSLSLFFFDTTYLAVFFRLLMIVMEQNPARLGDELRPMKEHPPAQMMDDWRWTLEDFERLE